MSDQIHFSDVIAIIIQKIQQIWNEYEFTESDFLEEIPPVKFLSSIDYDLM
ncbi:hypothetical protein NEF87_002613 [Candidatus Lokiarchaeum ossiferum]|uniref:Acyl carrier protein n=1 Tax=Candidatus Lokiarchaeum ossiferum TaxID=2951803 RepID=A0ABY6HS37_9ARCH|nr:hypothetical protein NEF87_002613 [Candidatus Lokiarchaeum sp. B-35]